MKVLAMMTLMPEVKIETVRAELANELKCSWALYASGVLREVYATGDPEKVAFMVEAADVEAARQILAPLPMIAAGMFKVEFVELRPFVNWSILFAH
jgi:muconolactone delta-isomerase